MTTDCSKDFNATNKNIMLKAKDKTNCAEVKPKAKAK